MGTYWYFAATLPGFLFASPPPLPVGDFLALCERNLKGEDYRLVRRIFDAAGKGETPSGKGNAFLEAYEAWERGFRNELSRIRSRRAGADSEKFIRKGPAADAAQAAAACAAASDPYQGELAIERERWNSVERLAALSSFDSDAILAYAMKLAIATRLSAFDGSGGRAAYSDMYKTILEGSGGSPEQASGAEHPMRGASR